MKIVITGASRGLGLALCKEALLRGWEVIALCRNISPQLAELNEQERIRCLSIDMGDPESIEARAKQILLEEVELDGIVNNAGVVLGREETIETLSLEDVRKSMEINVYGPMLLVQRLLPLLCKSKEIGVINISSSAGALKGTRTIDYPYSISKAALNMFTEKLRKQLLPVGAHVAAVHPGWMKTDLGGEDAAVLPKEVAVHILDMLCGKQKIEAEPAFVNRFGMPVLDRNQI